MTKHERQSEDDSAPLAKKVRYDNEEEEVEDAQILEEFLAAEEQLSFLDQVKELFGLYGAKGTSFGEVFLSLMKCDDKTKDDIRQFTVDPIICNPVTVKMDAFLDDLRQMWATHDIAMDNIWTDIIAALVKAGMGDFFISFLTKPSGPARAALCMLWHYATFSTNKPKYGMTLDRTNPCLALQWRKIADHSKASV
jgi:hypothetical protein